MKRGGTRFFCYLSLWLLSILMGCTQNSKIPDNAVPDIGVPFDRMNKTFGILIPKNFGNTYKNGEGLTMIVQAASSDSLAFTEDYDARIFIYENGQWNEIENTMMYPRKSEEPQIIIYPSKNDYAMKSATVSLAPFQQGLNREVRIRIFLTGSIYKNGTVSNEKATSFIDVPLKP